MINIYWIDRYRGGYRSGVTHAIPENSEKTLCGILIENHTWDGGYQDTTQLEIECKKCKKHLLKNELLK